MGRVRPASREGPTLAAAVDRFLSQPDLAASTVSSYRQSLEVLTAQLGASVPIKELNVADLAEVAKQRWVRAAPATWNRHVATLGSFAAYARARGWWDSDGTGLSRRREHPDRTRAIPTGELERLWRRQDVALRDRALWRLLYESAARASEVLSLDLAELDIDNKRARVTSKGGATEWVFFGASAARLLNRLVAARTTGPVFLTKRRPAPARAPAQVDLDPVTGKARLSYRRAEEVFHDATGWTLHQLRHSALTHLAEQNVSLPLLMGKSRHSSLRSLERYARPGPEAVAALTAAHDPARRRRR